MRPSQKGRHGYETTKNAKWGLDGPLFPSLKRPGGTSQPWPVRLHPAEHIHRSHIPPPRTLFHTRYAEESAERPHLVTVVHPCQATLRKVTVLLNRRGVVSFEQLLLDISEALGFPRWHGARVTRLYTTHAREVKGVCDFFRGEAAFLALGKARPELSGLQEALEELFPEHPHYRAHALKSWERRLHPSPNRATKADSGYSEGTDGSGTNQSTHVKNPDHHTSQHADAPEKRDPDSQKSSTKATRRKPAPPPNHLQRLRVKGGGREPKPSLCAPFKHEEALRDAGLPSGKLCENCSSRRAELQGPAVINKSLGMVPLPPVSRKQKGSSHTKQEVKNDVVSSPSPAVAASREDEKTNGQAPLVDRADTHRRKAPALPSERSSISLSDIERVYEFGRVIGDGNFAVVRECRRRDSGEPLALKIVERSKLVGREHMMQNELSLLGSLSHPRIVRLFAHHHTPTHSYLVMELVRGGDLFEAISDSGKFQEAEAGLMVSDVSEALEYIHGKSIVHRDLKPENLLIERVAAGVCRLKLGDFGLAMVVTEPVFTICGTPTYVAPEILHETGYGVAVDVWALGVILYVLLCGFPPFRSRERDQEELFKLIKQAQLHFPSPYWDSISEEAKNLVRCLIEVDPTLRLTSEQTLQHPWVKAMASVCMQRALIDKTQKKLQNARAKIKEPQTANSEELLTNKTERHCGSKEEVTLRRKTQLSLRDDDSPDMNLPSRSFDQIKTSESVNQSMNNLVFQSKQNSQKSSNQRFN
ncbi:Serine/threonine-protein kinase DCLK3 [Oryzias melastigma]|uniref:non-specific serine/threonine protein kinase n=1 Tax=Oryzias melastigma TaxID=30732 RepID=A0A834FPD8_ORYME|nr:Serine/threonine-protein kinase DCLK3 [Oryzias melastigma]